MSGMLFMTLLCCRLLRYVLPMVVLIRCSSVLCVLMALGIFIFVKVVSSLISVMSPPPCLCSLSVHMVV